MISIYMILTFVNNYNLPRKYAIRRAIHSDYIRAFHLAHVMNLCSDIWIYRYRGVLLKAISMIPTIYEYIDVMYDIVISDIWIYWCHGSCSDWSVILGCNCL